MSEERKQVELIMPQPSPYFSQMDEANFFRWLESLNISVRGSGDVLQVKFKTFNERTIHELVALMARYDLDMSCLATFAQHEEAKFLQDRSKYWYGRIFGDDQQ